MTHWIWKNDKWPNFTWNINKLTQSLSSARLAQGKLLGITQTIHANSREKLDEIILADQAIDTSAIEGERLNRDSVRSSIANRLGLERAGITAKPDRYIEGLLDMLLDATQNYDETLTFDRLYGWHGALFPTGYSGIRKISVATLRKPGPMHIISGRPGKEKIHYEAPPAEQLHEDMTTFLSWFNKPDQQDGLLRAGLSHLWFELMHPFEDGNGRIGRAIIDLALAQDEMLQTRYYSLSSAIMNNRKEYYTNLEEACRGDMDVTAWLSWFLSCYEEAILSACNLIKDINLKSKFWERYAQTQINERQAKVLNRLLDAGESGFTGDMTTRKYMQLTKTSRATAYRELSDLVEKRCLRPTKKSGRSSGYEINWGSVM